MLKRTRFDFVFIVFFAFIFLILIGGCVVTVTERTNGIEYRNDEVSYADGESCMERYLIYEETGTYERYMSGMYFGREVPGLYYGTLFETGSYELTETDSTVNIRFWPKKQYSFDTNELEYLGLENQVPYSGTLTETALTISWDVWIGLFEKIEIPIIYKRY